MENEDDLGAGQLIALVPARSGSKRIPGKNLKLLGGRPLVVHTLHAAFESECFEKVVLSTDSQEIASTGLDWCGKSLEVVIRPKHLAEDHSLDIDWIRHAYRTLMYEANKDAIEPAAFPTWAHGCILRPTSPFRGPETIQRAVAQWRDIRDQYDSMRAVRLATENAYKQWRWPGKYFGGTDDYELEPVTSIAAKKHLHSWPTQELATCYIQTAGLEIHWVTKVLDSGTIAGERVAGFLVEGPEALDINSPEDWEKAEALAEDMTRASQVEARAGSLPS